MNKSLSCLCTVFVLLLSSVLSAAAADKTTSKDVWITGEVFTKNDVLFFRAEKPVRNNTTGNVLLLGATTQTAKTLLPVYMKAAEKHLKLRLYGSLLPFSGSVPGHSESLPSLQFITWKVHLPEDPDELPPGQKIIIR